MRTFSHTAGRMALLNGDGETVDATAIDIDQQHGDGADAALLEMQEASGEVASNDAAIAELNNTAVALESLLESAEASVETGGLDPLSAEILTKAVNNETAPLGTDAEEIVPALESFSSSTNRRQSTVMAVESIKDWIEKVWAKIKELIQKGRDLAKKLYIKVKQAVQGYQRRIAGLKAELEKRDEKAPKAGQVELKDDKWATKEADVKKLVETVDSVLKDYADKAIAHAEAVASALNGGDAKKAEEAGGTEEEKKAKAEKKEFVVPAALENVSHKLKGNALPGNYAFFPQAVGFSIQQKTEAGGAVKAYAQRPLSFADIKGQLEALEGLAKQVVDFEKEFEKKDRAEEKVLAAGDKFAKEAKKEAVKGTEAEVRAAVNNAKEAAYLLDAPIKSTLQYAGTAMNGICSFLSANIAHYDKK